MARLFHAKSGDFTSAAPHGSLRHASEPLPNFSTEIILTVNNY
jgi:hypothetical protein